MPTGKEIRQAAGVRYDLVFLGKTTDAASVGSGPIDFFIDKTRLLMTPHPSQFMQGNYIRFTSGTIAGHQARIVELDASTGTMVFSPGWTGGTSIPSGVEYEIWQHEVIPDLVDRSRDNALTRLLSSWQVRPVTVVPDGDLMATDASAFTTSNATATKVTTATSPFRFGTRYLDVTASAINGYIETGGIPCRTTQTLYIEIPVSRYAGTGTLTLSASVAGTLSGGPTSVNSDGPATLAATFVPTADGVVKFRITSSAASTSFYVGPINAHFIGQGRITLPSRIATRKRVAPGFTIVATGGTLQGSYIERPQFTYDVGMERRQVGTQVELIFNPWLVARPYFYWERSYYDALQTDYFTPSGRSTGDAAVTPCPVEYAVAGTMVFLSEAMRAQNPQDPIWMTVNEMAKADLSFWEREFGPAPMLVEEEQQPSVPQLEV